MGTLQKLWVWGWIAWASYLSLDIADRAWNSTAWGIKNVVDNVWQVTLDVLNNIGVQIWDFAPLSKLWITDLANKLWVDTSLSELWLAWVVWLWGWYLWGKLTDILGKMTSTESDTDRRVWKAWGFLASSLAVLDSPLAAGTALATTSTYILSKKLSQLVLSEKYAHYLGLVSTAGMTSVAFGANDGTVIWAMLAAWVWWFIWDNTQESRNKQRENRKNQWFAKTHLWIWRRKKTGS